MSMRSPRGLHPTPGRLHHCPGRRNTGWGRRAGWHGQNPGAPRNHAHSNQTPNSVRPGLSGRTSTLALFRHIIWQWLASIWNPFPPTPKLNSQASGRSDRSTTYEADVKPHWLPVSGSCYTDQAGRRRRSGRYGAWRNPKFWHLSASTANDSVPNLIPLLFVFLRLTEDTSSLFYCEINHANQRIH